MRSVAQVDGLVWEVSVFSAYIFSFWFWSYSCFLENFLKGVFLFCLSSFMFIKFLILFYFWHKLEVRWIYLVTLMSDVRCTNIFKGTVSLISSDPPCKDIRYQCSFFFDLLIFICGFSAKLTCAFLGYRKQWRNSQK